MLKTSFLTKVVRQILKIEIFRPPSHLGLCHLAHTYQVWKFVGLYGASCALQQTKIAHWIIERQVW